MKSIWPKVCIVAVMSLAAFSISAQPLTLEDKVAKKFKRIERLTSKLENRSYAMRPLALKRLNQKLARTIELLKSQGNSIPEIPIDPIPAPIPFPAPLPATVSITGTIEGKPFIFDVVDAMDLVQQCVNRGTPSRVDDFTVSVDFSSPEREYTSGWWIGEMEICRMLAKKAVSMGLVHFPTQPIGYEVIGLIETKPFAFQGDSKRDIMVQCMNFHADHNIRNVDDILFYEDLEIVKKRTSGWWSNANEVCNVIMQQI